jgi:hypothetical protein
VLNVGFSELLVILGVTVVLIVGAGLLGRWLDRRGRSSPEP